MIKLQVIKDLCGNYIKFSKGKPTKVKNVSQASTFTNGSAQNFINSQVKKSQRDNYYIETIGVDFIDKKSKQEVHTPKQRQKLNCIEIVTDMNMELHKNFNKLYEQLQKELKQCDDDILDYRHYMRNPNTILNAVQLCKAAQLCQQLERKREEVKKELRRCEMLLNLGDYFQTKAENFEYEPYNPRGNMNFDKIIKNR